MMILMVMIMRRANASSDMLQSSLPPSAVSGRIAREEHRYPSYTGILLPTAQTSRGQHHQNHALHVLEVQGVVEGRLQLSMPEVVADSISIISDIAISGVFIRKEGRKEGSIHLGRGSSRCCLPSSLQRDLE
jgi:hypothetical protein